jgi:chromate transporter
VSFIHDRRKQIAYRTRDVKEIARHFFRLGWLAFGGPVAQVGLMHQDLVEREGWLDEQEFLRALNFAHILPGPEATQLAIYIGWKRRGYLAGILAGLLFIFPGYLTLCALACAYLRYGRTPALASVLWGFRPVGLALLCAALVRISRAALKGPVSVVLAALAFGAFHLLHAPFIVVLLSAGALYLAWDKLPRAGGPAAAALIFLLPIVARADAGESVGRRVLAISWFFLKLGLFSFGGAYAVLPYLREGAVSMHQWITDPQMIDALALGETTPGPLISIGTFVGYLAGDGAGAPLLGATAATFWLFLPSFVFVLAAARHLEWATSRPGVKELLKGITCGVVGLMFSASITLAQVAMAPHGTIDWLTVALGVTAFAVLQLWKSRWNVVAVVLAGGAVGLARALTGL